MTEPKLTYIDGELTFEADCCKEIDEAFLKRANCLLQEEAHNCRKELSAPLTLGIDKVAGYLSLIVGVAACVVAIVLAATFDSVYALIGVAGFACIFLGVYALHSVKRQTAWRNYVFNDCDVYCAKLVSESFLTSFVDVTFEVCIDGNVITSTCKLNFGSFNVLQDVPLFVVAYDKMADKFVPIKLFAPIDDKTAI